MTGTHQVTCIVPDGSDADQRIDAIGGATGGTNNGRWQLPIDQAIAAIEEGKWRFWTIADGKSVWVLVAQRPNGRKYLKTETDYYEPNNLLSLPHCPA